MERFCAVRFEPGVLHALDQTALPHEERWLALRSGEEVAEAIRRLAIRGAPLIGVAAAYGVAIDVAADPRPEALARSAALLSSARPTAVNLSRAVERVRAAAAVAPDPASAALAEAEAIHTEERDASEACAVAGAEHLAGVRQVMTHCNTGALAAPGRGTALAVVAELAARGELEGVIATETRPLLQGARLTVYELARLGISHRLVADGAAAGVIARGMVDAVIVGCDRVAANGDVANKVGTYPLALAAHAAGIPFVVVGPVSTIDPDCPSGAAIEIEQRDGSEVAALAGVALTLPGTECLNPAFDVTPAELVSALVTERGVAAPVTPASVAALSGARSTVVEVLDDAP
jgi:methylthioribose-1-phosphate isomerase